ncbi:MAG TPA: hypothetical protein DCE78_05975 [Bacteroidetes bacterium]|nr:hypothetical protein [Bacteroidota bacterium]
MFKPLGFIQILPIILILLLSVPFQSEAQNIDHKTLPFLKPGTSYLWPTNASDYMSATFGETRAAHFHAAIDVGTWGQQGFDVFASRDGIISRIGISPTGYGNVIYMKHEDGSYSMYAHLRDFVPKLRTLVDSIRFQTYRANFDQNLESYDIRYKKGDLIAFSGDTGIGPPHLHFELRTPSNNPFNPLLAGVRVPDKVPPRITGISVEPISFDATVNGRKSIQTITTRGSGSNFEFGTITTSGTVGLGVDASDRADAMRNVYAVYELKLTINDSLYFHSKADSFDITKARMMFLDRVYPVLRQQRKGYQRLFIRDGNENAFYEDVGHNGMVSLPPGTYQAKIEAADYFGNRSTATGRIQVIEPKVTSPVIVDLQPSEYEIPDISNGLPSSFKNLIWTNDWVASASTSSPKNITIRTPGSYSNEGLFYDLTDQRTTVNLRNASVLYARLDNEDMIIHRVIPGQSTTLRSPDLRMTIEFRPNSLYDTLSVVFAWKEKDGQYFLETGPSHEPLQTGYVLRFLLPDSLLSTPGLGIYQVNQSGNNTSYNYGGGIISNGSIQTITTNFGIYTFRNDTIPPEMSRPTIYRRSDGKWFASVRVSDNMSGVDFTLSEFYVNEVRGIAEYDPFGSRLIYHLPGFSPKARDNELRILLVDRAGNRNTETFRVNR